MEHKPCPFCGSTNNVLAGGTNYRWIRIECVECGAHGPETQQCYDAAWFLWDSRGEEELCSQPSASP